MISVLRNKVSALIVVAIMVTVNFTGTVDAARYSSPSYVIDASVDGSFGGQTTSTSYQMVAAGGESIVGNGSGGSYRIGMGYSAQLIKAIQINAAPSAVNFATIIAGSPQTATLNVETQTDSAGYTLAIAQNNNLTDSQSRTIPAISGSIGAPVMWNDGTTKGLGFTISNASQGIPPAWSSGSAYAAIPNSSTNFFTRSGYFTGIDTTTIRLKIDVPTSQVSGAYTNTLTITGTMIP